MKLLALLILSAIFTINAKPTKRLKHTNDRQIIVKIESTACANNAGCNECVQDDCAGITISRDQLKCEEECEKVNLKGKEKEKD